MPKKQTWFITGAGRGLGVDLAKAALSAGHAVVATGHNAERVSTAIGAHADLLPVELDVTSLDEAGDGARAALERSAASTSWSTTRATFTPGSSKKLRPRTSGRKLRPRCSAR